MSTWIISLISILIIPIIILPLSLIMIKFRSINYIFGYRTTRSMKNENTWVYANTLSGKLLAFGSLAFIVLDVIFMLIMLKKSENLLSALLLPVGFAPILLYLIVSIVIVELKLKSKFDKNGNLIK